MSATAEAFFSRIIGECQQAFERERAGLLRRMGLKHFVTEDYDGLRDTAHPHYKLLFDEGMVVWGATVMVNNGMFHPGNEDLPGVTVYSTDKTFHGFPRDLRSIAQACFELKRTLPDDPLLRPISDRLTDEIDPTARMPLPPELTNGKPVFMGTTMYHRSRLPDGVCSAGLFPVVIAPHQTELNMILPLRFWPRSLCDRWSELDQLVNRSDLNFDALRIIQQTRRRRRTLLWPEWDPDHIPVHVTNAMAMYFRQCVEERDDNRASYLWVGIDEHDQTAIVIVDSRDSATDVAFTSNGVPVVVRRKDLQRVHGTVIDFYASPFFESGIIIRGLDDQYLD